MADYTPYAPGINAARSIWDEGIAPLAGKAQDYFKGLAEIFPTVGEYVSESILRSGPKGTPTTTDLLLGIGKMGLEGRSVAREMGEYAKENPIEMGLSMAPWSGAAIGVMDAENLMAQARAAEEAGDEEKASTLRQLAVTSFLSSAPGVPRIVKKGGGDEALDSLDRANRNRAQRIEETGEGFVPSKDAPLPEGRRGDPYDPELDVLERQKRIEEATGVAPTEVNDPTSIKLRGFSDPDDARVSPEGVRLSGFGRGQTAIKTFDDLGEKFRTNPMNNKELISDGAAIEVSVIGDRLHIHSIRSFEKGTGEGSKLLDEVIRLADKNNTVLEGTPVPFGNKGLSTSQLTDWYARRGFVQGKNDLMIRQPVIHKEYGGIVTL